MGGHQKFLIPRYLLNDSWMFNKQWKTHLFHVLVPASILGFYSIRHALMTQNQYQDQKSYVDPEDYQAPKKLVL